MRDFYFCLYDSDAFFFFSSGSSDYLEPYMSIRENTKFGKKKLKIGLLAKTQKKILRVLPVVAPDVVVCLLASSHGHLVMPKHAGSSTLHIEPTSDISSQYYLNIFTFMLTILELYK